MTNAFAEAAARAAGQSSTPAPSENLGESFTGQDSQLFGGASLAPSLMNKSHPLGSKRSGVISAAPYDVHSRDFNTKKPKYWAISGDRKISLEPVDAQTGEKLRPVKDTVIPMTTDYRYDAAESSAIGRDPNASDDGSRAFYASGDDLKQLRAEIGRLKLRSAEEMIGLTLTVERSGQKQNPGANPSWINKVTLSK